MVAMKSQGAIIIYNLNAPPKRKELEMETYEETIYRYRILKHEELPEAHQECLRKRGIDPAEHWTIYMSFADEVDALEMTGHLQDDAADWETFKMVDAGEAVTVERPHW